MRRDVGFLSVTDSSYWKQVTTIKRISSTCNFLLIFRTYLRIFFILLSLLPPLYFDIFIRNVITLEYLRSRRLAPDSELYYLQDTMRGTRVCSSSETTSCWIYFYEHGVVNIRQH